MRHKAAALRIHLVAGYVVPLPGPDLRYKNKYVWLTPNGGIHHQYLKHRPVPGEPAVVGTGPHRAVDTGFGRASGALCYDYDFPALAAAHQRLEVDLVALPSSDWRGIDPLHTRMATLRAIEGGYSLIRSTRWGQSAVVDPYGRVRGQLSHFDDRRRILVATVPRHGVVTLYRRLGDWLIWLSLAYLATVLLFAAARRRVPRARHVMVDQSGPTPA